MALATRSGLRFELALFHRPGVGNTLGGYALQPDASNARGLRLYANPSIQSFCTRCYQYARGLHLKNIRTMLGVFAYDDQTLGGSTTTSPTTSIRQHHHNDSATV
jgi:hypothetical protein